MPAANAINSTLEAEVRYLLDQIFSLGTKLPGKKIDASVSDFLATDVATETIRRIRQSHVATGDFPAPADGLTDRKAIKQAFNCLRLQGIAAYLNYSDSAWAGPIQVV